MIIHKSLILQRHFVTLSFGNLSWSADWKFSARIFLIKTSLIFFTSPPKNPIQVFFQNILFLFLKSLLTFILIYLYLFRFWATTSTFSLIGSMQCKLLMTGYHSSLTSIFFFYLMLIHTLPQLGNKEKVFNAYNP